MDPCMLVANGEDPRAVLAVFGKLRNSDTLRGLFDVTHGLIKDAGLAANVVSIDVPKRYGRHQQLTPRIQRLMERNDITGFSLAHVPSPEVDAVKFGWLEGATAIDGFTITGRASFFSSREKVIQLALEVARVFPFTYGYHYLIDAAYGPGFHAVGMLYSSPGGKGMPKLVEPERRRTSAWFNDRSEVVPLGKLRDVFPLNLLSIVHRNRVKIDGIPLFDWIGQNNSRGYLAAVTPALWAWHVPEDRCIELGNAFEVAGLLASTRND
jgi:hypothetical protein